MNLTAKAAGALKEPGRYHDGGGLYLQIRIAPKSLAVLRSWLLRYMLNGKAREMGLGPFAERPADEGVTLAQARLKAAEQRKLIAAGIDPLVEREAVQHRETAEQARMKREAAAEAANLKTFQTVAEDYIGAHESSWKNAKHKQQWRNTLTTYVYPQIGWQAVGMIDQAAILDILKPIWEPTPETAGRVRGRIEAVLDYARTRGWRTGDNPARWRGHLEYALPARRKLPNGKVRHHPALPWQRMAEFVSELRRQPGTAATALELVILTAARTGEVLNATWREFDLDAAKWSIPAARMKGGRDHTVALSPAAVAVLKTLHPKERQADDFVLPGGRTDRPLSNMAIAMLIRRMNAPADAVDDATENRAPRWVDAKEAEITAHGFRSSFRDWAAENTPHPREVVEAALAHAIKDKTEAAYLRGDMFQKRVVLMADWGRWCAPADSTDKAPSPDTPPAA